MGGVYSESVQQCTINTRHDVPLSVNRHKTCPHTEPRRHGEFYNTSNFIRVYLRVFVAPCEYISHYQEMDNDIYIVVRITKWRHHFSKLNDFDYRRLILWMLKS